MKLGINAAIKIDGYENEPVIKKRGETRVFAVHQGRRNHQGQGEDNRTIFVYFIFLCKD